MTRRRIGVVGIGAMGAAMTRRLHDVNYELALYDKNSSKLREFAGRKGIRECRSPAEVASYSDVILLMVATGDQLRDAVYAGDSAAIHGMTANQTVVVTATVGTAAVTEVAGVLETRGSRLIDAPVSGGAARAERGMLLMLVGGPPEHVTSVRGLLDTLASELVVCGRQPGDGQDFKLVNQVLCGVHVLAAAEALALAEKLGIDPAEALRVLPKGAAASFMLTDRGQRMVEDAPSVKSALKIMAKDMKLIKDRAAEVSARTPLSDRVLDLFTEAMTRNLGSVDDSQVIEIYRNRQYTASLTAHPE